jgi:hypothetical protein
MTRLRWVCSALIVGAAIASMAHVGSPDTFFTGTAGPYSVRVSARLPGVVPGRAQITVRVSGVAPSAIRRVTVQAVQWNVGPEGAPPPDQARPVPGDSQLYAAELWLMAPTSYRVHVVVEGPDGTGTAVVPVLALATAQRGMSRGLGLLLAGLGAFLAAGLLTLIGAAVRETVLGPGAAPDARRRRRARAAMAAGAVIIATGLWGGRAWWNAEASSYGTFVLYRPFASEATVSATGGGQLLTLAIRDGRWPPPPGNVVTRYNALMPDHGKLMHMFLVREPDLGAFAHLHPVPRSTAMDNFTVQVPALPPGRYRVYGDIVHESGYAQTLVAAATITGEAGPNHPGDPDDTSFQGDAVRDEASPAFVAPDGTVITWRREPEPLVAGQDCLLTFGASAQDGEPVELEPYMGMLGHVAVSRDDGSVFAHLHPSGSVSMAALQKFERGIVFRDPHASHIEGPGHELSIPYAFPRPGRYRLWVQMKRAGRVVTGAFDATVR